MHPVSDRPARFYGKAKIHKFDHPRDITTESIKFQPIIDQTGRSTYQ